jgi:hypothetical protein
MSGQFPTNPNFSAINFKDEQTNASQSNFIWPQTSKTNRSTIFFFYSGMPPLQQEKAQEIFAFLQKQKGSFEDFTIVAPIDNLGASKSETDILVAGAHTAGDNTIAMDGFSQTTGALKAGD